MGRTQVRGSCACGQKGGQMSPLDPPNSPRFCCTAAFLYLVFITLLLIHLFQVKTLIQWLLIEVNLLPEHYSLQLYYPF